MIPLSSKVEKIKEINVPDKARDVHRFVGLVDYYRDMWGRRAHILFPVTKLCSTKVKFKCNSVEQNALIETK